jgi:hypothetical protein
LIFRKQGEFESFTPIESAVVEIGVRGSGESLVKEFFIAGYSPQVDALVVAEAVDVNGNMIGAANLRIVDILDYAYQTK